MLYVIFIPISLLIRLTMLLACSLSSCCSKYWQNIKDFFHHWRGNDDNSDPTFFVKPMEKHELYDRRVYSKFALMSWWADLDKPVIAHIKKNSRGSRFSERQLIKLREKVARCVHIFHLVGQISIPHALSLSVIYAVIVYVVLGCVETHIAIFYEVLPEIITMFYNVLANLLWPIFNISSLVIEDILRCIKDILRTMATHRNSCPNQEDFLLHKKQFRTISKRLNQQLYLVHHISNPIEMAFNLFKASHTIDQVIASHLNRSLKFEFVNSDARLLAAIGDDKSMLVEWLMIVIPCLFIMTDFDIDQMLLIHDTHIWYYEIKSI